MIIAYAVIIGGGLLITRRLSLLGLAATFWIDAGVGVGILAGSGHCMTANWSFTPVCGVDFWRVIVTSPEVLIFLFFMITDPKTMPSGPVGRVVFGLLVAIASTLLMAPQTDEFGTKVGAARRPRRRLRRPAAARPARARARLGRRRSGRFASRLAIGGRRAPDVLGALGRVALAVGAVFRGRRRHRRWPARRRARLSPPNTAAVLDRVPHQVDPSTFPAITVDQDVTDWDHEIAGPGRTRRSC